MVGHIRNQRDGPGPLDRSAQGPLVFGAYAGPATRFNFGPVRNEPTDFVDFFVIDMCYVFHTESAHAASGGEPASGTPTGPSSAWSSAWPSTTAPTLIALWRSTWSSTGFCGHDPVIPLRLTI